MAKKAGSKSRTRGLDVLTNGIFLLFWPLGREITSSIEANVFKVHFPQTQKYRTAFPLRPGTVALALLLKVVRAWPQSQHLALGQSPGAMMCEPGEPAEGVQRRATPGST